MGRVWRIHLIAEHGGPPREVDSAIVDAGRGFRGDRHYDGPLGDISIVEAEVLERLARDKDLDLRDGRTRRNVITRDIDLGTLVDSYFRIGELIGFGDEPCNPCKHVASLTSMHVLRYMANTGLRGTILRGGAIRVGDEIEVLDEAVAKSLLGVETTAGAPAQ